MCVRVRVRVLYYVLLKAQRWSTPLNAGCVFMPFTQFRMRTSMMFFSCLWPSCLSTLPPWFLHLTRGMESGKNPCTPHRVKFHYISSCLPWWSWYNHELFTRLDIGIGMIFSYLFVYFLRSRIKLTPCMSS